MAVKRKKEDDDEKEEAKELVTDMDAIKDAIQTCLDFEKEKRIRLINPRGKRQFLEMYKKKEPERKIEAIIDNRIDAKLNKQLSPLNKKIDVLVALLTSKDKEKTKEEKEETIDELKKKIDEL